MEMKKKKQVEEKKNTLRRVPIITYSTYVGGVHDVIVMKTQLTMIVIMTKRLNSVIMVKKSDVTLEAVNQQEIDLRYN